MAAYDQSKGVIYGGANGEWYTYADFLAFEAQTLQQEEADAATNIGTATSNFAAGNYAPIVPVEASRPPENFTGDCQQPNRPGFGGWASFADAASWANACTATKVQVPYIPPTSPSTPAGTAAGRGAPAASTTAVSGSLAAAGASTPRLQPRSEFGDEGSYCEFYPDDPLCDLWNGGGIVFGGPTGTTGVSQPVIVQEGLSATDVHGLIDGGLKTVWSAVVGAIDATVLVAIAAIQSALTALGNALKAAFAILARLGGFILNALRSLLHGLIKGILQVLQDIRNILKHVVDDVIAPMVKALGNLRDRILALYKRFVRPLIIIIQDVRRVLNILAIFHVPFAQKLDAKLGDLERRLTAPLLLLLRYGNQVANWMNLVVTANYLLQKPIFLWSLNAYKGESINLLANAMNVPASAATVAAARTSMGATTPQQTTADLQTFLTSGSGPYAASISAAGDVLTQSLQAQA